MPGLETERRLMQLELDMFEVQQLRTRMVIRDALPVDEVQVRKWMGAITGSSVQGDFEARWDYTVQAIAFDLTDGNNLISVKTGEGAKSATALNTIELAHIAEPDDEDAWYVWGVDVHGDDYPSTFAPRPVGGGGTSGTHKKTMPVLVTTQLDINGTELHWFSAMGSHDGTCG